VPIEPEHWSAIATQEDSPAHDTERRELLDSIRAAIETELSDR
jgi:hypothetical protein